MTMFLMKHEHSFLFSIRCWHSSSTLLACSIHKSHPYQFTRLRSEIGRYCRPRWIQYIPSSIQYGLPWLCISVFDYQSEIIWGHTNYLREIIGCYGQGTVSNTALFCLSASFVLNTISYAYVLNSSVFIYVCFPSSVPVVLVGNKTDLHQERAVSAEEGRKLAESWRANFLETSAKQNEVSSFIHSYVLP